MAFKIKDGVRIGTVDVFNNAGTLLVNAPTATQVGNTLTIGTGLSGTSYNGSAAVTIALNAGSSSTLGGIKLGSDTEQSTAANSVTSTASRTYAIQLNASGQAVVNVPWVDTDTVYTLPTATTTVLGGIKLGSDTVQSVAANATTATASRTYAVQVNASGQAVVNVPWVDTDTTVETDTLQTVTGRGATSNVATISLTGGTASTNTTSGTLVVTGGVGISGALNVGGSVTITGNLTVDGTTTTVNSTTVTVDDKNIELGSVASPDNTTADGGGITLKGTTDKTLNWINATGAWTSSEHFNLASGKAYYINTNSVLNATTLGSGVVNSSLTKVGLTSAGFVKSDASGNLSVDTSTYLTSYTETDTLATVTGRGNTTNSGIIQQASSTNVFARTAVTATVATTSATAVDTWATATYRSAKYVVQIVQGSNYQVSEILVIHDGSTTYMTEFAVLETNGALGTFTSAINGSNVELRVTMGSATSAAFKIEKVAVYA